MIKPILPVWRTDMRNKYREWKYTISKTGSRRRLKKVTNKVRRRNDKALIEQELEELWEEEEEKEELQQ